MAISIPCSYYSPKLEARTIIAKGHYGVFASEPIRMGELLIMWGGTVIHEKEYLIFPRDFVRLTVQIEDHLFLITKPGEEGPGDYINHSCNPNAGISGNIGVVAMRDIAANEEVCYDYAMTDGTSYDEFTCACGAPNCRGRITGDDWRNPILWERYDGYFSFYLQRRIEQLKSEVGLNHLEKAHISA
jgi:uncharacterized protein